MIQQNNLCEIYTKENIQFPLVDSSYDNQEILSCIGTLLGGQLTMGHQVAKFEAAFSEFIGLPYSVMVNSGSSANLLVFSAITNPLRDKHLLRGDKVAIPAVCWSTSLWPIIQTGLIPVLIDVDPETLNVSIECLKDALSQHDIKAIMMVHVLGNSTELGELLELAKNNKLILIEDTCESLGSRYLDNYLGSLGDFGTFSFYFSHHITTIEGGMVIAKTQEDMDLLRCLRTHGWSREQSNRQDLEQTYNHIDPRFLFINMGYNLRPMEIQAAFGLEQINRLGHMNKHRRENANKLRKAFSEHPLWKHQLYFPKATKDLDPCWFGFPFLVDENINCKRFAHELLNCGIDTRPIISGNMALQPAIKHFNVDLSMAPFAGAQEIHDRGFFIGCHAKPLKQARVDKLATIVLQCIEELS
ncbi:MAG: DegT/DnrJ/EryC1/StrS family aminotransferase [Planctomycetota bacterium]|mgnify:CR=1 FL=1|nr:MAG: DegT/DnrJ/EryC1/StrS family aminotransferase [Planctomycetota bacterium]